MELSGRVAVVTGFADDGMSVAMADVEGGRLEAQVDRLRGLGASVTGVPCDVGDCAGYRAPYPDPSFGSRAFTQLLPTRPDNPMLPDNWRAWKVLERFTGPFVTIYGERDVVAPQTPRQFVDRVPGALGQPHVVRPGGGHFLHEDVPDAYCEAMTRWLRATDPA